MSNPLVVLKAPLDLDLSPLTAHLWSERIAHRVVLDGDIQCLILADPRHAHTVATIVSQWREGTLAPPERESYSVKLTLALGQLFQAPMTTLIVGLILGVYCWMQFSQEWISWLEANRNLWPDYRNQIQTYFDIGLWSLWRPTLLHFSVLHLVNNVFWIWILGRAIEQKDGRLPMLVILLGSGLLGNTIQWWLAGPTFGGISGVVFGLMAWVGWRQISKKKQYQIPPALLGVMLVLLVLSMTVDQVIPGVTGMAHGGHIGGLVFGLGYAIFQRNRN